VSFFLKLHLPIFQVFLHDIHSLSSVYQ
jgi:hypothetical protein